VVGYLCYFAEVSLRASDRDDSLVFADPHYLGLMIFRAFEYVSYFQLHSLRPRAYLVIGRLLAEEAVGYVSTSRLLLLP